MAYLWSLFINSLMILPWIAVALVALVALRRDRQSLILQMQCFGAAGFFLITLTQWVISKLLQWTAAPTWVHSGASALFAFFLFVSLTTFALGYCAEKLSRQKGPVQVTATRVA